MTNEAAKGAVHLVAFGLCVTMGLYNAIEAVSREPEADSREPRRHRQHVINAVVYTVGGVWEAWHTFSHWRAA